MTKQKYEVRSFCSRCMKTVILGNLDTVELAETYYDYCHHCKGSGEKFYEIRKLSKNEMSDNPIDDGSPIVIYEG